MSVLVVDTCVLVNLAVTGRATNILQAWPTPIAVAAPAWAEFDLERNADADVVEVRGLIDVVTLTPSELVEFVRLAGRLGDGEAASIAVAAARKLALATDDKRAAGAAVALEPPLSVTSTAGLMRNWARGADALEVARALNRIEADACFRPPAADPSRGWWIRASQPPARSSVESSRGKVPLSV